MTLPPQRPRDHVGWLDALLRQPHRGAPDLLNLTNARADQITYFYQSRLPGELAEGVADRHFHPVVPTAAPDARRPLLTSAE